MKETVIITDRITWWEKCEWIKNNCTGYKDRTNWDLWQIGLDDIIFDINERDAMVYYLRWL